MSYTVKSAARAHERLEELDRAEYAEWEAADRAFDAGEFSDRYIQLARDKRAGSRLTNVAKRFGVTLHALLQEVECRPQVESHLFYEALYARQKQARELSAALATIPFP